MVKIIKNNKIFIFLLMIMTFALFLTSCSENGNKEVEVVSFTTEKDTYSYKDKITFAIKFDNKKNYTINSVEINEEVYPVICSDEDYSLVYVMDEKLIFTVGNDLYTLSSFTYTSSTSDGDESITEKCSKKCYIEHSLTVSNDIGIKSITITSQSDDEKFYINEPIKVVAEFDNPSEYPISKIDVSFVDSSNNATYNTVVVFKTDSSDNYSKYNFETELPATSDSYNVKINAIYYTKNAKLMSCNFDTNDENTKKLISVEKREIEVMSLEFDGMNSENIYTDVNGNTYTDENETINLKIKIKNESQVEINKLVINGQNYDILKSMISNNAISKVSTIKLGVKVSATATEGSITACKIALEQVKFTDKTANKLTMPVSNDVTLYVYDKIISSASDLASMKLNSETKTITGNYILNKNLILSGSEQNLFKNYKFNGLLEGNGKSITFNSTITNPLFDSIEKNGIIKNISLETGVFKNSNIIANTNYGIIKNIESKIKLFHQPLASQTQNIRGGLVGVNEGDINDILLNGSVEISGSNINKNAYNFSLIADTNNGNINRVVNNVINISGGSEMGNCLLFLTSRVNNGTINAIIYSFQGIDITKIEPVTLITDSAEIGTDAVFSDVFINTTFIEKIDMKYKFSEQLVDEDTEWYEKMLNTISNIKAKGEELFDKYILGEQQETENYIVWATLNQDKCLVEMASKEELGYGSSKEDAIRFYSSLLFASGGNDNFWTYTNTSIKFNFSINT